MAKSQKAAGAGMEEEEEEEICSRKVNQWRCKNASADNELHYCEEHYEYWEMEKKKLPPDEQRCSYTNGNGWRCKKFRMGLGEDENRIPKSKHCEKHFNYRVNSYLKKRSGNGEDAGCSATGPIQSRGSKRRNKVTEEDNRSLDVTGSIQPATSSDTIIGDGTIANITRKRENVKRTRDPGVKSKSTLEHYKTKSFELSLEKKKVELEKKKIECTKLQGQLAEIVETRKTAATEEIEPTPAVATECRRKMFSDLKNRVLREKNSNSTMDDCVESPFSKLLLSK